MIVKYNRIIIIAIVFVLYAAIDIQACVITFINDGNGVITLHNNLDSTLRPLAHNQQVRLGNAHQRADFTIYKKQPNKSIPSKMYTCRQKKCSSEGHIKLKFSDIENRTEATKLFTIVYHEPQASMVESLPIMKNNRTRSPLHKSVENEI